MVFTRVSNCQKVAEQILLTSGMVGWIDRVAEDIETNADPTDHLLRITSLCPEGHSCQILIADQSGTQLKSVGGLRNTAYGEADYVLVTSHGSLRIMCRVSRG